MAFLVLSFVLTVFLGGIVSAATSWNAPGFEGTLVWVFCFGGLGYIGHCVSSGTIRLRHGILIRRRESPALFWSVELGLMTLFSFAILWLPTVHWSEIS